MKTLHKKLQVIKATIGAVEKTQDNPYYKSKYFDINHLISLLQPLFEEQGIILLQPIMGNHVVTKLIDIETGEEEMSAMELPQVADPQKMGSAVTYYRRYSLQSLMGIYSGDREDDDGNKASGIEVNKKSQALPPKQWLTEEQFKITLKAKPEQIQNVLNTYNGVSNKAMKKEYRKALEAKLTELQIPQA